MIFICRTSAGGGDPATSDRLSVGAAKRPSSTGIRAAWCTRSHAVQVPSNNGRRAKTRRPPAVNDSPASKGQTRNRVRNDGFTLINPHTETGRESDCSAIPTG
jgi:hypothetical protein